MAYIERLTTDQEDLRLSTLRLGSVFLACGWTLLGMAILLSIYTFSDVRQGTSLMLWLVGLMGSLGLALVAVGEVKRSHNI